MSEVLAILCSDLHFTHSAPTARSAEPDWYAAMQRPIEEVKALSVKHGAPIFVAGDIFDRWYGADKEHTHQLCDFLRLAFYPREFHTIPGNHDLPNHSLDLIERSAYWTLKNSGTIRHLDQAAAFGTRLVVHPFSWGKKITPLNKERGDNRIHLALVHKFVWDKETGFPGAPDDGYVVNFYETVKGYDVVAVGDNHSPFEFKNIFNCGTFLRRKRDERKHKTRVGMLLDNGTVTTHYLDVSRDLWLEEKVEQEATKVVGESVLQELRDLGPDSLDFRELVKQGLQQNRLSAEAQQIVLKSLEGAK